MAHRWATTNAAKLQDRRSDLLLHLRRLQLVSHIHRGDRVGGTRGRGGGIGTAPSRVWARCTQSTTNARVSGPRRARRRREPGSSAGMFASPPGAVRGDTCQGCDGARSSRKEMLQCPLPRDANTRMVGADVPWRPARHENVEVQRLAGSLVFGHRLAQSPYADLVAPAMWSDVEHRFNSDYCGVVGFSTESPLFVAYVHPSHKIARRATVWRRR